MNPSTLRRVRFYEWAAHQLERLVLEARHRQLEALGGSAALLSMRREDIDLLLSIVRPGSGLHFRLLEREAALRDPSVRLAAAIMLNAIIPQDPFEKDG